MSTLAAGGCNGGEGQPSVGAVAGFVSAGEFSGDDGRAELPFGEVVGGIDVGMVYEGEEVVTLFVEAIADRLFQGVGARRGIEVGDKGIEDGAVARESIGRDVRESSFETHGGKKEAMAIGEEALTVEVM